MRHNPATCFLVLPAMMVGYGVWGWLGLLTALALPGGRTGLGWLKRKKQTPASTCTAPGSGGYGKGDAIQTVPQAACPADGIPAGRRQLETLLAKAQSLALGGRDRFGAQTCCLNIIQKTRKEDPLFRQASDLYLRTITTRSPRLPGERPGDRSWSDPPADRKTPPPPTKIIPFPRSACHR